jgi:hypothetical protein
MAQTKMTGANVVAFLESAGEVSPVFEKKARETFNSHDITDPDPSAWYDNEAFTDALFEIVDKAGEKTVQQAGREMTRVNDEILQQEQVDDGLAVLAEQHEAVHKNFSVESAGRVEHKQIGSTAYRIAGTGGYKYPQALLQGASMETVIQTSDATNVRVEDTETEGDEVVAFELHW